MARDFNGTSDLISLGSPDFVLSGTNTNIPISVSAWAKSDTVSGLQQVFGQMSGGFTFGTLFNGTQIIGQADGGATSSSVTAVAGTWYQVVFVIIPGSTSFISVNNTVDAGTSTLASTPGAVAAAIGSDPIRGRFFDGRLADVAVWNVSLTQHEALALNRGARPWNIRRQSLQAWLPCNGDTSPEADLSGKKWNGTLTGTVKVFGPPFSMFTPRRPQFTEIAPTGATILMGQAML